MPAARRPADYAFSALMGKDRDSLIKLSLFAGIQGNCGHGYADTAIVGSVKLSTYPLRKW